MRFKLKISVPLYEWHKWYAWHPVFIDNMIVWLEPVERKIIYGPLVFENMYGTTYYRFPSS
jgi:hypothetical protein